VENTDNLDGQKDKIIQELTTLYSRGDMDLPSFETAVVRVNASADLVALLAEARAHMGDARALEALSPRATVPRATAPRATAPRPAETSAVELSCVSGSIRKSGSWVDARRYRLALKSSVARLDFSSYAGAEGFRFELELEAVSSSIILLLPAGFSVDDRLSGRVSSSFRDKPKGEAFGDNRLTVSGDIRSSVVKVKYLR
jgi:hypothetical protein